MKGLVHGELEDLLAVLAHRVHDHDFGKEHVSHGKGTWVALPTAAWVGWVRRRILPPLQLQILRPRRK